MRIDDARRLSGICSADAEVLLAYVLGRSRAWLLAHGDDALPEDRITIWQEMLRRRRNHEPIAYIIGEKEFYGRMFSVTPSTLIPRPATEGLVELALDVLDGKVRSAYHSIDVDIVAYANIWGEVPAHPLITDIGTGSGCIAITLCYERPALRAMATDISEDALAVARVNAKTHGITDRIDFRHGNLLEPIGVISSPFLIVSNPPYVADTFVTDAEVDFEPRSAIYAGTEGMGVLRLLLRAAKAHPRCIGCIR